MEGIEDLKRNIPIVEERGSIGQLEVDSGVNAACSKLPIGITGVSFEPQQEDAPFTSQRRILTKLEAHPLRQGEHERYNILSENEQHQVSSQEERQILLQQEQQQHEQKEYIQQQQEKLEHQALHELKLKLEEHERQQQQQQQKQDAENAAAEEKLRNSIPEGYFISWDCGYEGIVANDVGVDKTGGGIGVVEVLGAEIEAIGDDKSTEISNILTRIEQLLAYRQEVDQLISFRVGRHVDVLASVGTAIQDVFGTFQRMLALVSETRRSQQHHQQLLLPHLKLSRQQKRMQHLQHQQHLLLSMQQVGLLLRLVEESIQLKKRAYTSALLMQGISLPLFQYTDEHSVVSSSGDCKESNKGVFDLYVVNNGGVNEGIKTLKCISSAKKKLEEIMYRHREDLQEQLRMVAYWLPPLPCHCGWVNVSHPVAIKGLVRTDRSEVEQRGYTDISKNGDLYSVKDACGDSLECENSIATKLSSMADVLDDKVEGNAACKANVDGTTGGSSDRGGGSGAGGAHKSTRTSQGCWESVSRSCAWQSYSDALSSLSLLPPSASVGAAVAAAVVAAAGEECTQVVLAFLPPQAQAFARMAAKRKDQKNFSSVQQFLDENYSCDIDGLYTKDTLVPPALNNFGVMSFDQKKFMQAAELASSIPCEYAIACISKLVEVIIRALKGMQVLLQWHLDQSNLLLRNSCKMMNAASYARLNSHNLQQEQQQPWSCNDNLGCICSVANEVDNSSSYKVDQSSCRYTALEFLPSNIRKGLFLLKVREELQQQRRFVWQQLQQLLVGVLKKKPWTNIAVGEDGCDLIEGAKIIKFVLAMGRAFYTYDDSGVKDLYGKNAHMVAMHAQNFKCAFSGEGKCDKCPLCADIRAAASSYISASQIYSSVDEKEVETLGGRTKDDIVKTIVNMYTSDSDICLIHSLSENLKDGLDGWRRGCMQKLLHILDDEKWLRLPVGRDFNLFVLNQNFDMLKQWVLPHTVLHVYRCSDRNRGKPNIHEDIRMWSECRSKTVQSADKYSARSDVIQRMNSQIEKGDAFVMCKICGDGYAFVEAIDLQQAKYMNFAQKIAVKSQNNDCRSLFDPSEICEQNKVDEAISNICESESKQSAYNILGMVLVVTVSNRFVCRQMQKLWDVVSWCDDLTEHAVECMVNFAQFYIFVAAVAALPTYITSALLGYNDADVCANYASKGLYMPYKQQNRQQMNCDLHFLCWRLPHLSYILKNQEKELKGLCRYADSDMQADDGNNNAHFSLFEVVKPTPKMQSPGCLWGVEQRLTAVEAAADMVYALFEQLHALGLGDEKDKRNEDNIDNILYTSTDNKVHQSTTNGGSTRGNILHKLSVNMRENLKKKTEDLMHATVELRSVTCFVAAYDLCYGSGISKEIFLDIANNMSKVNSVAHDGSIFVKNSRHGVYSDIYVSENAACVLNNCERHIEDLGRRLRFVGGGSIPPSCLILLWKYIGCRIKTDAAAAAADVQIPIDHGNRSLDILCLHAVSAAFKRLFDAAERQIRDAQEAAAVEYIQKNNLQMPACTSTFNSSDVYTNLTSLTYEKLNKGLGTKSFGSDETLILPLDAFDTFINILGSDPSFVLQWCMEQQKLMFVVNNYAEMPLPISVLASALRRLENADLLPKGQSEIFENQVESQLQMLDRQNL